MKRKNFYEKKTMAKELSNNKELKKLPSNSPSLKRKKY